MLLCPGKTCFLKRSIRAQGVSNWHEYDQGSGGASGEGPSNLAEGKMPAASTLTEACPCPGSALGAGGGQIDRRPPAALAVLSTPVALTKTHPETQASGAKAGLRSQLRSQRLLPEVAASEPGLDRA